MVAFVASLMPYYTISFTLFGSSGSASASAWHGFFGWFGALAALAGAVVLAVTIAGIALPSPVRMVVLGLFGLATVCTVLALFVVPGGSCDEAGVFGVSVCDNLNQGHGVGYWLALLAVVAGTVIAHHAPHRRMSRTRPPGR